ncbi:MAG: isochorismatase family protein [Candidatus Aminicenantes bacterium]
MKQVTFLFLFIVGYSLFLGTEPQPDRAKMMPALLVIDIQKEYLPIMDEKDIKPGLEMINHYIKLFRENGFPVIRVYHTDPKNGPAPGSENFKFVESALVNAEDPQIIKHTGSAFKQTDLEKYLQKNGCNTLFLCGLSAVGCVLATYTDAIDLKYNTFILKGALISHNSTLTGYVQEICRTFDYRSLKLLLENICR